MKNFAKILRVTLAIAATGTLMLLGASFGPALLGYESFIVTSGSMRNANPIGSVAVTRMVDVKTIKNGDVVSFQTDSGSRITHRVIAVEEENGQRVFTTKGDANRLPDPEPLRLAWGRVARVEWSVPYAGHLIRLARTPVGGILLFAVPVLGLLLDKRRRPKPRALREDAFSADKVPYPTLLCPHCGEGVSLVAVSSSQEMVHSEPGAPSGKAIEPQIAIPKITLADAGVPSLIDGALGPKLQEKDAGSFPMELANNASVSTGGHDGG